MGEYDVFRYVLDGSNKPVNMGYPLNTPQDDYFFYIMPDQRKAYYTSVQTDTRGSLDIYIVDFGLEENEVTINDDYDEMIAQFNSGPARIDTLAKRIKRKPFLVRLEIIDNGPKYNRIREYIPVVEEGDLEMYVPAADSYEVKVDLLADKEVAMTDVSGYQMVEEDTLELYKSNEDEKNVDSLLPTDERESQTKLLPDHPDEEDVLAYHTVEDNSVINTEESSNETQEILQTDTGAAVFKTYTIQVRAMPYSLDIYEHFGNLKGVKEYYCKDGLYRYAIGRVVGWSKAAEERLKIIGMGYDDAFIVHLDDLEARTVKGKIADGKLNVPYEYTILLKKAGSRLKTSDFTLEVMEHYTSSGNYVYTAGKYKYKSEAEKALERYVDKGYTDAVVIPVTELQ
jgi:hypothetical protein